METKKWYKSKAIWSGIVAVIIAVYNSTLVALADQCGVSGGVCFNLPQIPEFVYGILGFLGIYGRAVAKTQIK